MHRMNGTQGYKKNYRKLLEYQCLKFLALLSFGNFRSFAEEEDLKKIVVVDFRKSLFVRGWTSSIRSVGFPRSTRGKVKFHFSRFLFFKMLLAVDDR